MRDMYNFFPEYYQLSGEGFSELWENCIFVFDTNVLLDLYRYSTESRRNIFELLENDRIRARLWFPYHVKYEFEENYKGASNSLVEDKEKLAARVENVLKQEIREIAKRSEGKLPRDPLAPYTGKLLEVLKESLVKLEDAKSLCDEGVIDEKQNGLKRQIDELLSGNLGEGYTVEKLEQLHKEAQQRYSKEIPPGYEDSKKQTNPYGDYIIWSDALERAADEDKPLIFITNDSSKGDWFKKENRNEPRTELLREMIEETGKPGYIYTFKSFYKFATEKYLKLSVDEATSAEIRALEEHRRESKAENLRATITKFGRVVTRSELLDALGSGSVDATEKIMETIRESDALSRLWEDYKKYEARLLSLEYDWHNLQDRQGFLKSEEAKLAFEKEESSVGVQLNDTQDKKNEIMRGILSIVDD